MWNWNWLWEIVSGTVDKVYSMSAIHCYYHNSKKSNWKKSNLYGNSSYYIQKQPSRDVLIKKCREKMQQIYRRTPMPKCDFNKVAKQLHWNGTSAWVFPVNLLHTYFHLWRAKSGSWCKTGSSNFTKVMLKRYILFATKF